MTETEKLVVEMHKDPYPSRFAMEAAVELEVHAALGHVQTKTVGKVIQRAIDDAMAVALLSAGPLKLDTDRQVFFYEQDFYVLSNFSAFKLWRIINTYTYDFETSEQAYHAERFGHDRTLVNEVYRARSAHEAFRFAQANKHRQRPDWNAVKVDVMRDVLRAKASQHEYVRRKLLATGDRELIENSWRDDFWGWGPNRDGQNMLGKLWMEIRSELLSSPHPEGERVGMTTTR